MNKRFIVSFLLSVMALPAGAHDLWIEPSTFTPASGDVVALRLKVGEGFEGETVPRRTGRIERFFARSATGEVEVAGQDGHDPAGVLTVHGAGTTVVAYRSRPLRIELDAQKFESYLREEGLEHVIAARRARGESSKRGVEIYSRAVKSLLHSGSGSPVDEMLGLRLEMIRRGESFQVLFEGKPLPAALVVAVRRGAADDALRMRSDGTGTVTFSGLAKGEWLVKTVHMIPAPASVDADWESLWTSTTFAVP